MKVSKLIKQLQEYQKQYGDIEVSVYDTMEYSRELKLKFEVETLKPHADKQYKSSLYDVDKQWIGKAQTKFEQNESKTVLTIIPN